MALHACISGTTVEKIIHISNEEVYAELAKLYSAVILIDLKGERK
jgi:hypothetical protein